jgi:hypothetical protein
VGLANAVAHALTRRRAAERARCKRAAVQWRAAESCYGFLRVLRRGISFSFGEATCKQAQSL